MNPRDRFLLRRKPRVCLFAGAAYLMRPFDTADVFASAGFAQLEGSRVYREAAASFAEELREAQRAPDPDTLSDEEKAKLAAQNAHNAAASWRKFYTSIVQDADTFRAFYRRCCAVIRASVIGIGNLAPGADDSPFPLLLPVDADENLSEYLSPIPEEYRQEGDSPWFAEVDGDTLAPEQNLTDTEIIGLYFGAMQMQAARGDAALRPFSEEEKPRPSS